MTTKVKDEKEQPTFTTQTGQVLHLRPVSRMLIQAARIAAEQKVQVPRRPFYSVETDGNGKELHYHDHKSIAGDRFTDEERQGYIDWVNATLKEKEAGIEASAKACLTQGVIEDPPEEWDALLKSLNLPSTDDPLETKWRWLTHSVLLSMPELNALQDAIMQPVREYEERYAEARAVARATFQSAEGEQERPDSGQYASED